MKKTGHLLNSNNQKIDYLLLAGKKKGLIILCHGFGGSKENFCIKQTAVALNKLGYSTLLFDFTGQAKNEFNLEQQVKDLKTVIDYFNSTQSEITVVGHSMGGLTATLAAMQRNDIRKLILLNPFLYPFKRVHWDYTKYIMGTLFLYPFSKKIRSVYSYYFKSFFPSQLKVATLIIVGEKDKMVGPIHSHQFYKDITCEKKIINDGEIDHGLSTQNFVDRTVDHITNWLQEK